jgi:hypothetical protein
LRDFRRASLNLSVKNRKNGIYWYEIDGNYGLTSWGELVFARHKKALYEENVLEPPSNLVRFDGNFRKSCGERFADINEKIDLLARYMEHPQHACPKRLNFQSLKSGGHPRIPGATHEFYAWNDGAAKRIFCRMEGPDIVLLRLDDALH